MAVKTKDFLAKYKVAVEEGKNAREVAAVLRDKEVKDVTDNDLQWVASRTSAARSQLREQAKAKKLTDEQTEKLVETHIPFYRSRSGSGTVANLFDTLIASVQTETEAEKTE